MDSKEFIDNLNRDKARGNLAPHQIILLLSLLHIYLEDNNSNYDMIRLNSEFRNVWNSYKTKFKSKNNNIGLPLKVFVNKGYIEIEVTKPINDFRNNMELDTKISSIKISRLLINLFKDINLKEALISRIDK